MTEFDEAYTQAIKSLARMGETYDGRAYLVCFGNGSCELQRGNKVIEEFDDIEEFINYMEKHYGNNSR